MNLNQLRVFTTICQEGSLTRAAQVLQISQPAVSKQLLDLEADLGTPLFDRLPRGVRATQAGQVLQEHAQRILASERAAEGDYSCGVDLGSRGRPVVRRRERLAATLRNAAAMASAASRLMRRMVCSRSVAAVKLPELTSMAVSASLWSNTRWPPDLSHTLRPRLVSIWASTPK